MNKTAGGCIRCQITTEVWEEKAQSNLIDVMDKILSEKVLTEDDGKFLRLFDPNFAYLEYDFNEVQPYYNEKGNMISHSSVSYQDDPIKDYFTVINPDFEYTTEKVGKYKNLNLVQNGSKPWNRRVCTEAKLLSTLKSRLYPDSEGTIHLYTLLEPCLSCDDVISQFVREFENIKIFIYFHTNGYNKGDC